MAGNQDLTFAIKAVNEAKGVLRDVQTDVDRVTSKADDASDGAGKLTGMLGTAGAVAGGFVAANVIAGGFDKVSGAIGDSIDGYREQMKVSAQTDAVLKSTAGAAGVTADQVLGLAGALKEQSLFADDAIQSGENLLLTFTGIGKDVFPEATQTMVDMSQALGQDLGSSAVQLGKALNDPINGVTALQRVGVTFTDQQKDQIKAMVESGDVAGAQQLILAELGREFGGSAKAASDAAGAQERYKDKMDDVQDTIGEKLLPIQEKWKEAQLAAIDLILTKVLPTIQKLAEDAGPYFEKFMTYWHEHVEPAINNIQKAFEFLSPIILPILDQIVLNFRTAFEIIGGILNVLILLLQGDFAGAWEAAKGVVNTAMEYIKGTIGNAKDFILGALGILKDVGIQLLGGLLEGAQTKAGEIANWFFALPGKIVDQIPNPLSVLYSIGMSIMRGLLDGLKAGWDAVAGFVGGVAGKIASLKGPIEVDRQLLVPHGGAIMEGLGEGISKGFDVEVRPRLASITNSPRDGIPSYAPRGGFGGGVVYNVVIHITQPLGTPDQIARAVQGALVSLERRGGISAGTTRPVAV